MCGITGVFNLDREPVSPVVLGDMTRILAHRGPDGEGLYTDAGVGLGHRRLAILDLSPAGHQPMMSPDGRLVIVLNGEIYNFLDLRIELESLGHQFHSRTDTEVVLHGFAQWGEKVLDRLNGMFAFAILDRSSRSLFLARDRYGVKPLYHALVGDTFLFGSEVKAILQHPAYTTSLDKEALVEYFTFQNIFTERTLFAGVKLLPPGTWMRIREGTRHRDEVKYWDFDFREPDTFEDDAAYLEELDRLLRQAISRQLVSDVEVGAYLSGGLDSGTVTAFAAKDIANLKSFTCGFDLHSASGIEISFDERQSAELMSYLFRTEHYEMVLKAGDMERVMATLAWHVEEPRLGQCYPNFYAAKLASRFVKVVLSGAGGDELFGGYPWRYLHGMGCLSFDEYIDAYYGYWQRLVPNGKLPGVLAPIWGDVRHVDTKEIFRGVFSRQSEVERPEDFINQSMYFEAKTFLHGLFVVEDKMSMAQGLETRVPFLDNDLVDFATKMPVHLKVANLGAALQMNENEPGPKSEKYFQRTHDGKLALRTVMSNYLPEEIARGAKQGFSAPDASWFKGESIEYVRTTIMGDRARIWEFLERDKVSALVQEHLDGKHNRRLLIWSLISFEHWLRTFLH